MEVGEFEQRLMGKTGVLAVMKETVFETFYELLI